MNTRIYSLLSIAFFIGTIIVNYLATSLPIGGKTTGELSDAYPNLFTPAGFTFSIWGVIYTALFVFIVFQSRGIFNKQSEKNDAFLLQITPWFLASCVFNMCWILAWHYQYVLLSVGIMLGILYSLFNIVLLISKSESNKQIDGLLFFKIPFGLYFGWIIVATVANVTTLLVDINWGRFGISETVWTATMLLVATAITVFAAKQMNSIFIGFSVLWALYGIISKRFDRLDVEPFAELPYLGIGCMVVLAIALVFSARTNRA